MCNCYFINNNDIIKQKTIGLFIKVQIILKTNSCIPKTSFIIITSKNTIGLLTTGMIKILNHNQ